MSFKKCIIFFIISAAVVLAINGCAGNVETTKDRPVAVIGANKIYQPNLDREVLHSFQVVRNNRRNDFFGFSPLRTLKIMRANLAYLIQSTALVLPAGSLDKEEITKAAEAKAQETADEVYEKLLAGEDWNKLNEEYSAYENKGKGGELPAFTKGESGFPDEFYDLEPGDILPPFKWAYWGYGVARLDSISKTAEGQPQYHASIILIVPDEAAVKNDMIQDVLRRKQVEILDPPLKGFDMYLNGDYDGAIAFLEDKSPAPGWPDLGYYVMSMCAAAKGDTDARLNYLKKAVEHSQQSAGLLSYYEIEIGDIMLAKGDESAEGYFRDAYDHHGNNMDVVKLTLERFEASGDTEYAEKAKARLADMEAINKRLPASGTPTGTVAQGEVTADKPSFEDL